MGSAIRNYGGATALQRRARRRAALLDAALDLFAEGGWKAVTMRAVCAHARLNDRYFYENFTDRDALLQAVSEDLTAQGVETVLTAMAAAPPDIRARIRAATEAALTFVTQDPRRGALLLGSQSSEALQRSRLDSTRAIATVMAAQSRDLLGESAPSDIDTELAAFTLVSGAFELVSAWLRGDFDITREHLTDFLTAMILTGVDIATALDRDKAPASDPGTLSNPGCGRSAPTGGGG